MVKIKGFKEFYVCKNGEVLDIRTGKYLKKTKQGGYLTVILDNGIRHEKVALHRLVAKYFIDNEENKEFVNHINGNKKDNRVENLEWCTRGENIKHAWDSGLISCRLSRKLSKEDVLDIYNSDAPMVELRDKYNLTPDQVRNIKKGNGRYVKMCLGLQY